VSEAAQPGKADLHVHTALGDSMASPREILDYVEAETDLDIVAITDHDDLRGAMQTRDAWAKRDYRFQIIPGMEVTAIEGHIIGLFIEEPLPSLKPVEEVLEAVHRQGGLAIAAHPLSWLTRSLNEKALERIAGSSQEGTFLDGLETANQAPGARGRLKRVIALNRQRYHLAEVGGSDAHFLKVIGSAYTEFPGRSAEDLRRSIVERASRGVNGHHPTLLEIGPWQVLHQTWRGLTVTPRTLGWGATAGSFIKRIFSVR
jgi:predicted metal-dependent phosphoesterase TrpH